MLLIAAIVAFIAYEAFKNQSIMVRGQSPLMPNGQTVQTAQGPAQTANAISSIERAIQNAIRQQAGQPKSSGGGSSSGGLGNGGGGGGRPSMSGFSQPSNQEIVDISPQLNMQNKIPTEAAGTANFDPSLSTVVNQDGSLNGSLSSLTSTGLAPAPGLDPNIESVTDSGSLNSSLNSLTSFGPDTQMVPTLDTSSQTSSDGVIAGQDNVLLVDPLAGFGQTSDFPTSDAGSFFASGGGDTLDSTSVDTGSWDSGVEL